MRGKKNQPQNMSSKIAQIDSDNQKQTANCCKCNIQFKLSSLCFYTHTCGNMLCILCLNQLLINNKHKAIIQLFLPCCLKDYQKKVQKKQIEQFIKKNCVLCSDNNKKFQAKTFNDYNLFVHRICFQNLYNKQRNQAEEKILNDIIKNQKRQCFAKCNKQCDKQINILTGSEAQRNYGICQKCQKQMMKQIGKKQNSQKGINSSNKCCKCVQQKVEFWLDKQKKLQQLRLVEYQGKWYCPFCLYMDFQNRYRGIIENKNMENSIPQKFFQSKKAIQQIFLKNCMLCATNNQKQIDIYRLRTQNQFEILSFVCDKCCSLIIKKDQFQYRCITKFKQYCLIKYQPYNNALYKSSRIGFQLSVEANLQRMALLKQEIEENQQKLPNKQINQQTKHTKQLVKQAKQAKQQTIKNQNKYENTSIRNQTKQLNDQTKTANYQYKQKNFQPEQKRQNTLQTKQQPFIHEDKTGNNFNNNKYKNASNNVTESLKDKHLSLNDNNFKAQRSIDKKQTQIKHLGKNSNQQMITPQQKEQFQLTNAQNQSNDYICQKLQTNSSIKPNKIPSNKNLSYQNGYLQLGNQAHYKGGRQSNGVMLSNDDRFKYQKNRQPSKFDQPDGLKPYNDKTAITTTKLHNQKLPPQIGKQAKLKFQIPLRLLRFDNQLYKQIVRQEQIQFNNLYSQKSLQKIKSIQQNKFVQQQSQHQCRLKNCKNKQKLLNYSIMCQYCFMNYLAGNLGHQDQSTIRSMFIQNSTKQS